MTTEGTKRHVVSITERWFKTDMTYVLKGGFWMNLPQIVSALMSLLVAFVFANFAAAETYGSYKYILSLGVVIGAFSLTGMNTAVIRAVAQGKEGSFLDSISVQFKWSILTLIAALAIGTYYLVNGNYVLAGGVLVIALFQPILDVTNTFTAYLSGKKNFKLLSIYNLVSHTLSSIGVILAVVFNQNVVVIVLAYLGTSALLSASFYLKTTRTLRRNEQRDEETIAYGKKLSLLNGLSIISSQLDSVLIFHYLGARELAIFSFAVIIPEKVKSLFRFTSVIALPKLSAKTPEETKNIVKSKTFKLAVVSVCIIVAYITIAPFLYNLVFNQYLESAAYSQVFALTLLSIAAYMPTTALLSHGLSKELYTFSIATPIVQITTTFFLVYFFGIWGAVWARVIGSYFNFTLSMYLTLKQPK